MERFIYIINIAIEAVFVNKSRSILTALGIIFGVAAVIAMMAIGNGAQQEILEQMKMVGVNNIVITPKSEKDKSENEEDDGQMAVKEKYSPKLTLKDAQSIKKIIPTVERVCPEVSFETYLQKGGKRGKAKLAGITPDFFKVFNLDLSEGEMFNFKQLQDGKAVCIIGPDIQAKFFLDEEAVGNYIKCGFIWLKVVGVLENRSITEAVSANLGIDEYNKTVFAPIQTLLRRFKDRSLITGASLNGGGVIISGNAMFSFGSSEEQNDYNQLNKIVVQVKETDQLIPTTEILKKMIARRHSGVDDFEIKVPELLLRQEQRTKDVFNIVLGAIASISLIVGGIGIMNIMLASVMERIKEIGIRKATGATKKDIIFQFLAEATMISLSGGIIGIFLGIALSKLITEITDIQTIISGFSIVISFGVSATVGILFGYMPARKAARQDAVDSLRHE